MRSCREQGRLFGSGTRRSGGYNYSLKLVVETDKAKLLFKKILSHCCMTAPYTGFNGTLGAEAPFCDDCLAK